MSKRTNAERIERYKKKIQKLEESEFRRTSRTFISDESDDNIQPCAAAGESEEVPSIAIEELDEPTNEDLNVPFFEQVPTCSTQAQAETEIIPPAQTEQAPAAEVLDPELLLALGDPTADTPDFGEPIHESLSKLWFPLLKKGLPKEIKDKLLKEYLVPDNCRLLQAPKPNAEISAAVAETVRGRDKKYLAIQQQLGQGIAAINKGMHILLISDSRINALKHLSDGCRILSDIHSLFTKDRTKLITPSLDKSFLHILQDTERDETLFGNTLSEKIKASKAIEKQGQQIKKNLTHNTKTNSLPSMGNRSALTPVQGNWPGPSRYPPATRGGRGGPKRYPQTTRRSYNMTSSSTTQSKPHQHKSRAPQQQ